MTLLAVVTMKDGLLSGYRYTVQADGGVGTLTIRDARLLDGAEYTCQVASTLHGSSLAQRSTRLIVEDSELCLLQPCPRFIGHNNASSPKPPDFSL